MHPLRLLSLWLWCGHCLAAVAPLPEPVVTERGPDHKVWTRVQQHTLANGRVVTRTSSYKELGTAMHYWRDGQWVEAQPVFETPAYRGQHPVAQADGGSIAKVALGLLDRAGDCLSAHVKTGTDDAPRRIPQYTPARIRP